KPPVGGKTMRLLVDLALLQQVESLDLTSSSLPPEAMAMLLESPHLSRLTALRLIREETALRRLDNSPVMERLTFLQLNGYATGSTAWFLGSGRFTSLRHLELTGGEPTLQEMSALSHPSLAQLETLSLAQSRPAQRQAIAALARVRLPELRRLDL